MTVIQKLKNIDYASLQISDYSRDYIIRMLPHLEYYFDIYERCIQKALSLSGKPAGQLTMVDYGGGHGFLSFLAKSKGIGQVVYVDFNPQAVQTVHALSDMLVTGPDVVIEGDAMVLRRWCERESVVPDVLLGMDVIEHIYCLDDFFSDIFAVNRDMAMVFTTGSTPYNRRVVNRLHKVMVDDEMGVAGRPGFRAMRRDFIALHFTDMPAGQLDYWAVHTRGLNYDDVLRAVDSQSPNLLSDPFNTCDPSTGSWTERILPIRDYQTLVQAYGASLCVENGFYNSYRKGLKGLLSKWLNRPLLKGRMRSMAPFIVLTVSSR